MGMRVNRDIPDKLLQTYREQKQREIEKWKLAQQHLQKWQDSDCENESEYEEYQSAYYEYEAAMRISNAYARTIADYVLEAQNGTN